MMRDYIIHRNAEDELYHFGILGMKWGVRRYQNEDGTLTEAGKKRYRSDDKFAEKYDQGKRRKSYAEFNSEKELKKRYSEANEKSQFIRRDSTLKKYEDDVKKTDEYKKYARMNDQLMELARLSGGFVTADQTYMNEYREAYKSYVKKGQEILKDRMDQLASDVLTDLNYKDTIAGREYLKELGFEKWDFKISDH